MQKTPDLSSPADIDKFVMWSSRDICKTAELLLGRKSSGDTAWINQEIIDMSNERHKQDHENKDRFKQLKRQIEKKTCRVHKDMTPNKCQ